MPRRHLRVVAGLAVSVWASVCAAAVLDFENVPVGTRYGRQFGNTPGQIVLTQDGIRMSVENFFFTSQNFVGFARGEVGGNVDPFFPSTPLELDNLNVRFDFTQVGFDVTQVSLEYLELGGLDNFSVNGQPIIETTPLSLLPTNIAPGVALLNELLDASTGRSRITLIGDIDSVLIGGQEFGVDTIIAIPEPATIAQLSVCGFALVILRRRRANA